MIPYKPLDVHVNRYIIDPEIGNCWGVLIKLPTTSSANV